MTTATFTWPAQADLEELCRDITSVFDRMSALSDVAEKLSEGLEQPDGKWRETVPSLEEFSALSQFIVKAELDLREITTWLDELEALRENAAWSLVIERSSDAS